MSPIRPRSPPDGPAARCAAPLPSGWPVLDELLGGGWPVGALIEVCGRGRTSLALSATRQAQARALPVAWIDGGGVFCPVTAGVDLRALTLVRPDEGFWDGGRSDGGESFSAARRGRLRRLGTGGPLLAADLLLRSRAFALVVLDLPEGRPPLSRWFRLARQAERAAAWLLVLGRPGPPRTGSAAGLSLQCRLRPVGRRPLGLGDWGEPPPPRFEVTLRRHRSRADEIWPGEGRVLLGRPEPVSARD